MSGNEWWNVLRLNPVNQEKYVEQVKQDYPNIEIYYPQYSRMSRPRRCRYTVLVEEPVYPGYIFVRPREDEDVYRLLRVPVRVFYVKFGGSIALVAERVIVELREKEQRGELIKEEQIESPWRPGVKVVIHTPVADIAAVIVRMCGEQKAVCETNIGRWSAGVHQLSLV